MITREEELTNISKNYAIIPQKLPFNSRREDLSKYQIFNHSKISKEELDNYLQFCQDLFPTHEEESGILLSQKINKMKALKFLHTANYNVIRAKFKLKYPIIFQYASNHNIKLLLTQNQMASMLNEQISQKNPRLNQQENELYFKMEEILKGNEQVSEKIFSELITMAKNKRIRLPSSVYEVEQNIAMYNSQIQQELLSKVPNIQRIKQILDQLSKYPVLPKLYEELKQKLFSIEQVLFNIDHFETIQEINLQKAFELLDQVDRLGIQLDIQNPKQRYFLEFTQEAKKNIEIIDIILNNKQHKEKIKMNQLCQVMNFFTRNNIEQNTKLIDLLGYLEKNDRIKENCLMWAEDEKNMNQFPMINDLFQSNIDYQNDVTYVVKKIDAIMIFKEIYDNINNEQELFENIRKIKEYQKKNYPWWKEQINYMQKICEGLKCVDDKVEEINKLNCSMDQFLFGDKGCLMNYEELRQTVDNQYLINNKSGYYLKIKEFIKDFQKFLEKCLENDCNNKDYFQKINKLLQYSIFKENEMSLIKNELLIRIKFDCQIYYFFYKVFKRKYDFYFQNFFYYFENQLKEIPDMEHFSKFLEDNYLLASKSVFNEQIKLFLERAGLQELQNKIFNHNITNTNNNLQQSQISINNNFIQNHNQQNSIQESSVVLQQVNQNGQNNNHHFQVKKSILSDSEDLAQPFQNQIIQQKDNDIEQFENWIANLNIFQTYDNNIRKQYPLMQGLENEIFCYQDNLEKSNEFNRKNLDNMKTLYNISKNSKIEITQSLIKQFEKFVIHTPQKRQAIDNYNKFLDIFKIYKKYSDLYQEYKNYKTNRYNFFALKLPLYYIIFYKLRIVGVEVDFLENIEKEIQQDQKINSFLQFKEKTTINQSIDVYNKLKFLQIYNFQYDFLKRIVKLYLSFENVIYKINKKYNNYNFFKNQIQIENNNEIQNYKIKVMIQQINLERQEQTIFDNLTNFETQSLNSISTKLYKSQTLKIKLHDHAIKSLQNQNSCYCNQPCQIDDQQLLTLSPCKTKCHRICLKVLLKQQEKRLPCPACKYLEYAEDSEIQNLLTMKLTQSNFILVYKAYAFLKNYLVNINFIYIETIYQNLLNLTKKIQNFKNQEVECRDNYLHDIALAYLLLPIRILSVEKKIFDLLSSDRQLNINLYMYYFF